jgi:hypothetical protein
MKTRLTTDQARAFRERVGSTFRFLFLCRERLKALGFDSKSKLFQSVEDAYDAMRSLHIELHYQSIPHGVGRPFVDEDRCWGAGPHIRP